MVVLEIPLGVGVGDQTPANVGIASGQTVTANAQTITAPVVGINQFVQSSAAFTGLILSPGRFDGDTIRIINANTTGANSLTFAAAATSRVALGTASAISGNASVTLTWSSVKALWY